MQEDELKAILEQVANGADIGEAVSKIQGFEDIGYAMVDCQRAKRQGVGEVIYGAGKTDEQIISIAHRLMAHGQKNILVTRVKNPKALQDAGALLYEDAKIAVFDPVDIEAQGGVLVICAGTSDLAVAEEAAVTAHYLGARVERLYDVGVAGLHRLLHHAPKLKQCNVIIVVAGMEGALPSVVGGLTDRPIIAVPTSVGYGASFGGLSALLAMLNTCASGVSVVNIDNGFGAGYQAAMINRLCKSLPKRA